MSSLADTSSPTEKIVEGIPASGGIAIAQTYILIEEDEEHTEHHEFDDEEVEIELERFQGALLEADRVLTEIEALAREEVNERAEIFEALKMMLHDPTLTEAISRHIVEKRTSARAAIHAEMGTLADLFTGSTDETMRTRADDMHALQSHLIASLVKAPVVHKFHHDAVLVLSTLLPSDTLLYTRNGAAAFVLESGGINSHSAILARALGVPMVAGLRGIASIARPHATTIVDGYTGRVIIDPSPETLETYHARKAELDAQRAEYSAIRDLIAETSDGEKVCVAANLDMVEEMETAQANGAEEIGLMRTEYLVMGRDGDIGMEEQLHYYRQIAQRAYPLRVTFRAFDIGTEKLTGGDWGHGHSPLGLRGARLLLLRREILLRQIEAILRASTMKNLQLMLPMVTSVEEMREFRKMVEDVKRVLRAEGTAFDEHIALGAMIETPASALTADILADESDFLSIGSNDLAQYTLAVDRSDDALSDYYDEFHPGLLRLIRACALAATRSNKSLTLCGEFASNPLATKLLIGLGIRRFSVPPLQLGPLKLRARGIDSQEAHHNARAALRMRTGKEVRAYLSSL